MRRPYSLIIHKNAGKLSENRLQKEEKKPQPKTRIDFFPPVFLFFVWERIRGGGEYSCFLSGGGGDIVVPKKLPFVLILPKPEKR